MFSGNQRKKYYLSRHIGIRGFTLIELLVVISIISMLSSVVFGSVQSAREKARIASGIKFERHTMGALGDKILAYYDFNDIDSCNGSNQLTRMTTKWASSNMDLRPGGLASSCSVLSQDAPNGGEDDRSLNLSNLTGNYVSNSSAFVDVPDFQEMSVGFWIKGSSNISSSNFIKFETTNNNIINPQIMISKGAAYAPPIIINNTIFIPKSVFDFDDKWHYLFFSFGSEFNIYIDGNIKHTIAISELNETKTSLKLTLFKSGSANPPVQIDNLIYFADSI